jgi:hypothetical protein
MNRILIDYRKLPHDVASLLIELYPHGYGDEDLIVLKKPTGEIIEAVEVKTNDTIYLVKISKSLANFISNFEETIEKELGNQESEPISNSELETEKGLEPEV